MKSRSSVLLLALSAAIMGGCGSNDRPAGEGPTGIPSVDQRPAGIPIKWGEAKNGVACGVAASKDRYVLGEKVVLLVFLRSTRAREFKCHISRIGSYRLQKDGTRHMALIVDATGEQFTKGKEYVIPPNSFVSILTQEFPTRPSMNLMSDIHFMPGKTPLKVICTPMFEQKQGPLLAGKLSGIESGVARVEVIEVDLKARMESAKVKLASLIPQSMVVSRSELVELGKGKGILLHASPRDETKAHPSLALFLWPQANPKNIPYETGEGTHTFRRIGSSAEFRVYYSGPSGLIRKSIQEGFCTREER